MRVKFTFPLFLLLIFALTASQAVSAQCTPGAPVVFTNGTPVAIPTGPGVATSTINVAGAPTYLHDLNITTFIQHTFNADLDITIQSPAGTVVTLSTDNGGANDDVFNGTVWDDDIDPGSQVPYTANNALVTERVYANLTLASPLVPEEPLAAFTGENPNGTWTITISDDLSGDGGTLSSWSLSITGLTAPPITSNFAFTNSTPVAIPTGPGVITSTINVAGAGTHLLDLNLTTFITHSFNADLDITIQSPTGKIVTLTTDNGGANDNVYNGTVWDDDANPAGQVPYTSNNGLVTDHTFANLTLASPLTPEEALGAFIGDNPNGTWTITISDDLSGDGGTLNSWTLNMVTGVCSVVSPCTLTCPANIVVSNNANQCGAIVNFPVATGSGICGNITATPASGSFFPVGTTLVTQRSDALFGQTAPVENGSPSQNFEVANDAFDCEAADDFTVPAGHTWTITRVAVGGQSAGVATSIKVTFYSNTAGLPGAVIANFPAITTFVGAPNYIITLPSSVVLNGGGGGTTYWMSVQVNQDFGTQGQWFWNNYGAAPDGNEYAWQNPNGGFGTPCTSWGYGGSSCGVGGGTTRNNIFSLFGSGPPNATCTFTVRVNDTQPPSITCVNITVGNTPGQCGAVVNFAPVATDNCPGVTVTSVPASGSFFPVGVTNVTSTATDAAGNTATCSFTVRVNDTEPPIFSAPGLFPERLYYKFDGAGATVPNLATAPPPGTATATLTGLTQGAAGKCGGALIGTGTTNQSLNTNWVTNMAAPWTISFWLGPNQVDQNPSYLFGDVTATGGATGAFRCFYGGAALTNNVLLRGGSADVLITGVNPGATLITIVYSGGTNTVVYKNGGSPQAYAVSFASVGTGPFRVGGYSTLASVNGRLDEFSMYSRALTPAEVLSIFNTCPTNVSNCPANITQNNDPGLCSAVVTYTTPVGLDNCPGVTTTQIAGLPSGSVFPVGVTVNTFRATDAAGNTALCTFNVTVNDAEQPTFTICRPNVVIPTDLNQCYATYTPLQPTFADNCAVTRLTWSITNPLGVVTNSPATGINYIPSTQFILNGTTGFGVSTIVYTAADAAGNTRTCTWTVRVNDAQIPVISSQPATKFVCVGTPGNIPVVATANGGPIAYQWQEWNGSAWVNIAGATAATFTIPAVSFTDNTRTFRCILTGRCSVVTSNVATLYINPLPSVTVNTSIPPSLTPGQSLNITSSVSPGGGSYAWYKDNVLVAGATGSSLSGLTVDDIGTYRLTYTDLNGCVNNSANVVVSGQPVDKLWVYPNPNNGAFQVRFYNQSGESATINVYDAKGARIYQNGFVTTTAYTKLDVDLGPTIPSGVYVVELVNGSGKRVGASRVVVRRN